MFPLIDEDRHVKRGSLSILTIPRLPTPTRKPLTLLNLLAFAKETTATFHKLAQDLADQAGIKGYCSSLVSKLWAIEEWLSQLKDLIEADIKKRYRLLYYLEQLFSVSAFHVPYIIPNIIRHEHVQTPL